MYYLNTQTGEYPVTEGFVRSEFPNTSFTVPAAPEPYVFVAESMRPEFDPLTQEMVEIAPTQTEQGWVRQWKVRELPPEVAQEKQKEAHDRRAAQVRGDRNSLLVQSDWTQVADAPVDQAAWAAYRQSLRDITAQEGFPFDVQWPVPPA